MRKLLSILTLLCVSYISYTQCTVQAYLEANGNTVTISLEGAGAMEPSYQIDWGDGTTPSMAQTDSHTYTEAGSYIITYYYFDQQDLFGCNSVGAQEIIITGGLCSLNFTVEQTGLLAHVIATAPNTGVPYYTINWGDGSPVDVLSNAYHLYAQPGNYSICVSMVDLDNIFNCSLVECQEISVQNQSGDCQVDAALTVTGNEVNVEAVGLGAQNGQYTIMWGDGTYDSDSSSSHTYNMIDTFQVCVFYTDELNANCQSGWCQEVVIQEPGNSCELAVDIVTDGMTATVQVSSTGAQSPQFSLDWGDNSGIGFDFPAQHEYASPGTYLVCVSLTDLANVLTCQVNQCEEITVPDSLTSCSVEMSFVQNANQITVTGTGTGASNPFYTIEWGDESSPSAGPIATHDYSSAGSYVVCVTYTDLNASGSCMSIICDTVDVSTSVNALSVSSNSLSVFPIPMKGQTQIHARFERAQNVELELLDITGRVLALLYQGTIGQEERIVFWNAESWPPGAYLIRARGEGESCIQHVLR